jgi:hypothetical protein
MIRRALHRRQAAQIGQTLLGHDDLHVMLGVIDMRDHGHDAVDLAALGREGVMKIDR